MVVRNSIISFQIMISEPQISNHNSTKNKSAFTIYKNFDIIIK